jgi:hypothetical protein
LFVENKNSPRTLVLSIVTILTIIGFLFGMGATKNNGWVEKHLKREETLVVEPSRSKEDIERDKRIDKRWGN